MAAPKVMAIELAVDNGWLFCLRCWAGVAKADRPSDAVKRDAEHGDQCEECLAFLGCEGRFQGGKWDR
jgi:hypothetical protein